MPAGCLLQRELSGAAALGREPARALSRLHRWPPNGCPHSPLAGCPPPAAGYFTHMTLGEGGTWEEAKAKIRQDFLPTFGAEVVFWPPLQTLNFKVRAAWGPGARDRPSFCVPASHLLLQAGLGRLFRETGGDTPLLLWQGRAQQRRPQCLAQQALLRWKQNEPHWCCGA